jgi:hypothetical protein
MTGALSGSVLATYEQGSVGRTARRLVDRFDLITGTSAGGTVDSSVQRMPELSFLRSGQARRARKILSFPERTRR